MAGNEVWVDFEHGQPTTLVGIGLEPELDETVILPGSVADYGYRVPFTNEVGEVFLYMAAHGPGATLEVYPLDRADNSVLIIVECFDFANASVIGAINLAYQARAVRVLDDHAA